MSLAARIRALAHQDTLFQIVVGPFILHWRAGPQPVLGQKQYGTGGFVDRSMVLVAFFNKQAQA